MVSSTTSVCSTRLIATLEQVPWCRDVQEPVRYAVAASTRTDAQAVTTLRGFCVAPHVVHGRNEPIDITSLEECVGAERADVSER